jgi:hypothetical protein
MSTLLYLTASSSGVTLPTADGAVWDGGNTAGSANSLLSPTKGGTNAAVTATETSTTNNQDLILRRFVSAAFLRQRLLSPGGTESLGPLLIAVQENNTGANMGLHCRLCLLRANGSTVTSMLQFTTGGEWSTTLTGRSESPGLITETLAQAGDRLVLEIGTRAANTSSTSYTATFRHGGTDSTNLATGTTGVTTRSPHVTLPNSFDVLWTVANSTMPMAGGFGGFFV